MANPDRVPEGEATHHDILVIGGGNAGLSIAGRLRRLLGRTRSITVIEPRGTHLYKPLFSHIAGGTAPARLAQRPQAEVTPRGVAWIQDAVTSIDPEGRAVHLASGATHTYEQLIVCPGIQKNWGGIPGLSEAMRSPSGVSNYEFDLAAKASTTLRDLTRGTVVFTQPPGDASCAGAAQKPMYLACDFWRARGVLDDIRVVLVVPTETIFGMPLIDRELERKIAEYGIEVRFASTLDEVDAGARVATIEGPDGARERLTYDVLHAVPPQSAPDWIARGPLAGPGIPGGFIDVDPETLRHTRHPDVWALGDAAATGTSKSGGALRPQAKAVAKNVIAALRGRPAPARYNGYSVCPFTVTRHSVVFAEFDAEYRPKPTIPFWRGLARERRLTWVFDRRILPWVYWHLILQGRA
jgi:sulfide:quinone oxidoreductase